MSFNYDTEIKNCILEEVSAYIVVFKYGCLNFKTLHSDRESPISAKTSAGLKIQPQQWC